MPVVGTAGHVDHGKSTLVKRLTGREPDRWAEEQQRGLTIDLGFAWTTLPDGTEVSFVDVPGHDRFIKNMLAGVEAIDVAMFVVAADEGWMPQSEEHLAVLDLLGVSGGIIALTKTDRVDAELIELATLEISEHLEGTKLESAPIIPVSSHSGSGIDELVAALGSATAALADPGDTQVRLWVDRSFSVAGAGTVVTGTLLGGPISLGEELVVLPEGLAVRVRGLQSHEQERETVVAGSRVAVSVGGVDRSKIGRGSMLSRPGAFLSTDTLIASIRHARYVDEVTDRGAYHLHLGSGAWPVRIRRISDDMVRIRLDEPIPAAMGDRFILRDSGRRLVVAGGRIVDPGPTRTGRIDPERYAPLVVALEHGPNQRADALLELRRIESEPRLAAHTGGGSPTKGFGHAGTWLSESHLNDISARVGDVIRRFHTDNPLRPGIGLAELAEGQGLTPSMVTAIIGTLGDVRTDGAYAVADQFAPAFTNEQRSRLDAAKSTLAEAGAAGVPRSNEIGIDADLLHAAVRLGELVQISPEFVFLPEQVAELIDALRDFETPFGVSEFKDQTGLSRKYAVPFLEWTDSRGLTVRTGDTRRFKG